MDEYVVESRIERELRVCSRLADKLSTSNNSLKELHKLLEELFTLWNKKLQYAIDYPPTSITSPRRAYI